METNYKCDKCTQEYKTKNGLQKHIRQKHPNNKDIVDKAFNCKYCSKNFKHRQSCWFHEQKCKNDNSETLLEKYNELSEKIKVLESKPASSSSIINANNNNSHNNVAVTQYIINAPGTETWEIKILCIFTSQPYLIKKIHIFFDNETISHLTLDKQREIMQKGLNSLTHLIELNNFNKNIPENHSYCVTALNDKHASMINPDTNKVIKTDKNTLFDKILVGNLKNLEIISMNPGFKQNETKEYSEKIRTLKDVLFMNRNGLKKYYQEINLLSYNNKDLIMETWGSLKNLDKIIESEKMGKNELVKPTGLESLLYEDEQEQSDSDSDYIEEMEKKRQFLKRLTSKKETTPIILSEYEESDDEIVDMIEIEIKGKQYILEGNNVYTKTNNGMKGEYYGVYKDGKVKKNVVKDVIV